MGLQSFLNSLQEKIGVPPTRLKGIAAQMYSVRDFTKTAEDLDETLGKLAEIGYSSVQMSAVGCFDPDDAIVSASVVKGMLDAHGLTCCATHRPWERLRDHTEAEIERHQTIGCDYIAVGMAPQYCYKEGPTAWRNWLAELPPVLDKLTAAGIRFGFHNHAIEFEVRDDERAFEILVAEADSRMQFEIDTYWLIHAGIDVNATVELLKGRLDCVHLKDKEVVGWETRFAPVGEGNMNWGSIVPALLAAGTEWLIIEQDDCYGRDPFDCLASSLEFVQDLLPE